MQTSAAAFEPWSRRRPESEHPRLLAGPDLAAGAESFREHIRRFGRLPAGSHEIIRDIERTGLTGRGGAAFPVGVKWRSVAARSQGAAVIIANGAEGEPQSRKDQLLMSARPHLVLDGAFLAAAAVGATKVVVLVGGQFQGAWSAMAHALAERPDHERPPLADAAGTAKVRGR